MKLTLFYDRTVHDNAARCYELAKEARQKIAGLEKAIGETGKEIEKAEKGRKKEARVKREREWYEKFHFAFTSCGKLMLGGRNAQQNDMLFAKHMDDADLFFHADIQGASAVVLKGGAELPGSGSGGEGGGGNAGEEERRATGERGGDWVAGKAGRGDAGEGGHGNAGEGVAGDAAKNELAEAAQFAASFSKAWVNGNASVDVYAVRKSQVSKHATGGFIPVGAFAISGERLWFRATRLALRIGLGEKGIALVPELTAINAKPGTPKLRSPLVLVPSQAGKDKGSIAKSLARRYGVHPDGLLELLPNGRTKTLETP